MELLSTTQYLAIAAQVALASWLLWIRFDSPVNRSFAAFLVLRAAATAGNRVAAEAADPRLAAAGSNFALFALLALLPALAFFLVAYELPRTARSRLAKLFILLAAVALEALFLWDPCLHQCVGANGIRLGPLAMLGYFALPLGYGLVGLRLAVGPRRGAAEDSAAFLVSAGFVLNGLLDGAILTGSLARAGGIPAAYAPSAWTTAVFTVAAASLLPSFVALAVYARTLRRPGQHPGIKRVFVLAPLALASGFGVAAATTPPWQDVATFVIGLWRLVLPALVTVALLRHRLFGLDVKLRWTISRGAVATVFVATFLVVTQVSQNYLTAEYGWAVGGAGAGLLLVVLSPLERVGRRLAEAAVPARSPHAMDLQERHAFYLRHATAVWGDGVVGAKERRILDTMRRELGVDVDVARDLEAKAAWAAGFASAAAGRAPDGHGANAL